MEPDWDDEPDDDYCSNCAGWRNVPLMDPLACMCAKDWERDDPPDHDPATLRPGEPPEEVHTIHLPGDDRQ